MKTIEIQTDKLKTSGYGLICLGFIVPVIIIISSLARTTELLIVILTLPMVFNLIGWWIVLSCDKDEEIIKGTIILSSVYAFITTLALISVFVWTK
jgi:hypothetical protein